MIKYLVTALVSHANIISGWRLLYVHTKGIGIYEAAVTLECPMPGVELV